MRFINSRVFNLLVIYKALTAGLVLFFIAPSFSQAKPNINQVDQYLKNNETVQSLGELVLRQNAVQYVWDSHRYVAELSRLNTFFKVTQDSTQKQKILLLARDLQLKWESWAFTFLDSKNKITSTGTLVGTSLALISTLYLPSSIPTYFKIIRASAPLLGATIAYQGGSMIQLHKDRPAPSQFFEFMVDLPPSRLQGNSIGDFELAKMLTSATTASETYAALSKIKWATFSLSQINKGLTPLKINPWALLGSLIVGLVVEKGGDWVLERWSYTHHQKFISRYFLNDRFTNTEMTSLLKEEIAFLSFQLSETPGNIELSDDSLDLLAILQIENHATKNDTIQVIKQLRPGSWQRLSHWLDSTEKLFCFKSKLLNRLIKKHQDLHHDPLYINSFEEILVLSLLIKNNKQPWLNYSDALQNVSYSALLSNRAMEGP